MCNQAVCLIAAEMERQGITTVVLQFLREVTEKIRPPRALVVPFPHGYPLGRPRDPELHKRILQAALQLTKEPGPGPILLEYPPDA